MSIWIRRRGPAAAALGIALVSSLAFLWTKTGDAAGSDYFEERATLQQIHVLDTSWELDVMRSKTGLHANYDTLVDPLVELRALQQKLHQRGRASADKLSSVASLDHAIDEKTQLIERFKSHNSVLRNSLDFLPTAGRDAQRPTRASQPDANAILLATMEYSQSPTGGASTRIASLVAALPPSPEADIFAAHVRAVLREQPVVNELLGSIARVPTTQCITRIAEVLDREQAAIERETRGYGQALALFAAMLVILLFIAAIRLLRNHAEIARVNRELHEANAGLEARVDARTSELREVNASLESATRAAEGATVAKSSFLASMSHEIRTPLNGVLGMAQSLQGDGLPAEQLEKIQVILDCGRTLTALLNDVLDISKIEAGKMELSPVDGDVSAVIERTLQLFAQRAEEAHVKLTFDRPNPPLARLKFDSTRVQQCISNLVSNAIKFAENGHVVVQLRASLAPDGERRVEVVVSDTGIGMSAGTVDKLFSTFTQADGSISRRFGGSGLGLSIARNLARLMGGDIVVQSAVGVGSTFTFTFVAPASTGSSATSGSYADPSVNLMLPRGARVLLVDDNSVNRQVVKLFLAGSAPHVTEAVNGREALDRLAADVFDLVLLDVHMPVMDGLEAIGRIRASGQAWAGIPVIALTADAMSGDQERFLNLGMSGYTSKPINRYELYSEINRVLDLSCEAQHREPDQAQALPAPAKGAAAAGMLDLDLDDILAGIDRAAG
jgi:signal transduction histidine kinase/FixJ family two-component response regulator